MAERSKAVHSSCTLFGGVGSNPTLVKFGFVILIKIISLLFDHIKYVSFVPVYLTPMYHTKVLSFVCIAL